MSDNKKYYYLKVKETFFDSEEMKVLESLPNGLAYQNFYLKVCLLSLKSGGALLFKGAIPYDMTMLATVLRINIDTVKTGLDILQKFNLVEILDNGTIYMSDLQALIGQSSTEGERVKAYRERIKGIGCTKDVRTYENRTPELELNIEKEIKKDIRDENRPDKPARAQFVKPILSDVSLYCKERGDKVDPQKWFDYYTSNGWKVGKNPMKDWKAAVRTWENNGYNQSNGYSKPKRDLSSGYQLPDGMDEMPGGFK